MVLIIDDDSSLRDSVSEVLKLAHYEVVTAQDSIQAMEVFGRETIHIVLLDIRMPGMSGWSVLKRLVSSCPLLPVIVMTALSNQQAVAEILGADALMEKPPDMAELLRLVHQFSHETLSERLNRLEGGARSFLIGKSISSLASPLNE
jgi:DNA-binding NtrC family response regulator